METAEAVERREVDQEKSEAFADRLITMLNSGALSLMVSIGHRTGLFDVLEGMDWATSEEIARKAVLEERYVREWLGAMVTGEIVECDPRGPRYYLPVEHAAWMTREAAPDNVAVFAQYIPLLGTVEDEIIDCFKRGGGVPYSSYKRFHEVMAEDSGQTVVAALLDCILPLVPGLRERLEEGMEVLDVGCGSARALVLMAREFPHSRFTGYDLSREAIEGARESAAREGLRNITLEVRDLTRFPGEKKFDLITAFDAIHDQARPDKVLSGICGALKEGGTFLMQDIGASSHVHKNLDHPIAPLLYTISCMHCMSVSLAQKGAGLGAMWGRELAEEMLKKAGFGSVEVKQLDHDFQNYYYIVTKNEG